MDDIEKAAQAIVDMSLFLTTKVSSESNNDSKCMYSVILNSICTLVGDIPSVHAVSGGGPPAVV